MNIEQALIEQTLRPDEVAALIPATPILLGYRGSVAHGMYVPPTEPTGIDDIDLMGVFVPSLRYYLGDGQGRDTVERWVRHYDSVAYELRKYVSLLVKANPNVLSLLWLDEYLICTPEGRMLVDARDLFSTKNAYQSFSGYAFGQLKRMTSFKDLESTCGCSGEFHQAECAVAKERGRGSTKRFATGFMGAKRKGLVEKFGYDVKNAAHLMRLLKMGIEFVLTGKLVVDRRVAGDAEELLEIKRGEWSLARVKAEADSLFIVLSNSLRDSPLPDAPDERLVNELLLDILCSVHSSRVTLHNAWRLNGKPSVYREAQDD